MSSLSSQLSEYSGDFSLKQVKSTVYLKSLISGIVSSFIMYLVVISGIGSGLSPYDIPVSNVITIKLGLPAKPFALIFHFIYGIFWSFVAVYFFREKMTKGKGVLVAMLLWLILMLFYSPVIGWGFFGTGGAKGMKLKFLLDSAPNFVLYTFLVHLLYGYIMGWMNASWISTEHDLEKEYKILK